MFNIKYLKDYNDYIPINISGRELYQENSIAIFIAKISDYLKSFYKDTKKLDIKKMIEEKRFVFLIDDIQSLYSSLLEDVINLDNIIIASFTIKDYDIPDENLLNFDTDKIIEENFTKLSIKPMSKKNKKKLTQNIVPVEIQDKISNKVIKTINKLRLPSNPFITTLLSWMYIEKIDIRENEPQIIDVFLDYLLEKADLSKTFNGKIDFNDKKDVLSAIAYTYFINDSLAIKEDQIIKSIIDYSEEHFAFEINSKDILEYFYQRRILIKNNNLVQFSYRVFYYYFITLYMISDQKFYTSILENKNYIVNMVDELRYYSALKRNDTVFLDKLNEYMGYNRLQMLFKALPEIQKIHTPVLNILPDEEEIEESTEDNKKIIPVEEKEKFQEAIDEIETNKREQKIDNYNRKETLDVGSLKFPKEEYFILNMIYSEFVKHLSGTSIGKTYKEKYFLNSIQNYTNIMRYWEEQFKKDETLKRFFKIKFPDEKDIKDEELNDFKSFIQIDILNMISYISNKTLSTPKMTEFYSNILNNNNSNTYEIFFALIFSLENIYNHENIMQQLSNFIKNNTNTNLNKLIRIKLYNIIGSNQINANITKEIKKTLIDLEFIIHNLTNDKGGRRKKEVIDAVEKNIELSKLLS